MMAGKMAGAQVGSAQIEAELVVLAAGLEPVRPRGPGRPPLLAATVLWASLTIGVLRGATACETVVIRL